jgi:2-C-methyl-D-erythritol 4-phosphate cytidylyltransferase
MLKKTALIVAGGSGTRMKSITPKQFRLILGQPVLMHTIKVFYAYDPEIEIRLVLPAGFIGHWNDLCSESSFLIPHMIIAGGLNRFESVRNGIKGTEPGQLIAVHDGVRPMVSHDTIKRCFDAAALYGNAVPCVDIRESIRRTDKYGNNEQLTGRASKSFRLRRFLKAQYFTKPMMQNTMRVLRMMQALLKGRGIRSSL